MQAIRNYLNNHRYQDLSLEDVAKIKKKEEKAKDKELCDVVTYLHPEEVDSIAGEDQGSGIVATKKRRAAREIYLGMDEEGQKTVKDLVEGWKKNGFPPELQEK